MGKRNYERLSIEQFGRHLITTGDLDPVYLACSEAFDDTDQLNRFLVAYWCFYHCGVACYLSQYNGKEFWQKMMEAAKNETEAPDGGRWPRGSERRHFRGQAAVKAVKKLWGQYMHDPETMVSQFTGYREEPIDFAEVDRRVREWPLFGPWIAFKVGDMLERVHQVPVDFTEGHIFMFKDPTKAALMLWRSKHGFDDTVKPKDQDAVIHEVVEYLKGEFADLQAPPYRDRPVGLQEVETVLCKWKSHMNGHYPLFNDIDEITEGVEAWADLSSVAHNFLEALPEGSNAG